MRNKEVDAIIAYSLDRLSRDPVHLIILQEELERAGVELILVTETIDSSDLGKLITYIKGYAAKLEVEKIRERTTRGRAYYCCSSKSRNNRPKICSAKNIRGDSLEAAVWDSVSRLLSRPELIMEQVKNRGQANPSAYLEANLDRLPHALGRKKVEADRMLDAYKIGAIDLQTLKQKMDEIKNEEAGLNEEKLRLEKELHKAKTQELNEEKLYQFCQNLPTTLANLTFEDKRQILREVVDKVIVNEDEVTIYGIIPMPEDKVDDVSVALPSSW